ncbi:hypothetical protein HDU93_002312, partial [Gonapodya sp. JEL0774]
MAFRLRVVHALGSNLLVVREDSCPTSVAQLISFIKSRILELEDVPDDEINMNFVDADGETRVPIVADDDVERLWK